MKRLLSIFFVSLLLIVNTPLWGTTASLTPNEQAWLKEHPVIKVGGEMDWAPFDFVDSNGEYRGIVNDYLQKISEYTGARFQVVTGHDWLELLEMFRSGEIDMLPILFHNKQREAFVTFTKPYLQLDQYFFVREENDNIYTIEDLVGKTLAVIEGYYTEDIIREKYPRVNLLPVENITEGLNSLIMGKADAFIESLAPASYAIEQNYLTGIKAVNRVDFAPANLYMGVGKGNTTLRDILQKGLDSISPEEQAAIRKKWVSMKPENQGVRLTTEEKAWRKAHPVIRVGSGDDWAPFNFRERNGKFQGITKEYLDLLEKKSGLKIDLHVGKWNDVLQQFKSGELDLLPAALYNKEREQYGDFLPAHISLRDFIYARSDDETIRSFNDLNGKRLARIKGYATLDPYLPHLKNVTIVEVGTTLELIGAVLNNKADAFLESPATINHVLRENMIGGLKSIVQTVSQPTTAHMLVKKGEPLLYRILKKSLDAITPAERDVIYNKWVFLTGETKSIHLSDAEKAWLRAHKVLRFAGDPNWLPLEAFNEKGEYVGIVADYLKLIEERLGIRFDRIRTRDFDESIAMAQKGQIDVISEVVESDIRSHVTFTKAYIDNPLVIVMSEKQNYVDDLNAIKDRRIAVIKGYGYLPKLYKTYPDIRFEYVDNIQEGLSAVSTGKVDAFVGTFILASYHISKMGLANIKIVGKTKVVTELGLGVRKDLAPFVGILNKVLASIDEPTRNEIFGRWIKQEYVEKIDYTLLWQIVGGAMFILLIVGYWNRKLTEANRQIEEQKRQVDTILEHIVFPMIITNKATRKIVYANPFAYRQYETTKEELIGSPVNVLYTETDERAQILNALGDKESLQNFETQFKTMRGNVFDALLSLITIPYDGEESFLGLVTDITEQKNKEREISELHKNTKASIEYAALIQHALIPDNSLIRKYFSDYFAIWHPRDVVGGDIYLFEELRNDDEALLMVIDCTGHGVPGAFVTMLVKAIERQIVGGLLGSDERVSPAKILAIFNQHMKHLLKQENEDSVSNAGFDAGVVYFNKKEKLVRYAGAEIPLYWIEEGMLRMIKGDRHSIGYKKSKADFVFTDHDLPMRPGTSFYLTTDGYTDQNGGENGFPLGKRAFKRLIEANHTESMADQQEILLYAMQEYMNGYEKNDDVTIIGVRI